MAVERVEVSGGDALEALAPVSTVPAVQGQGLPGVAARERREGKSRRQPQPSAEVSVDLSGTTQGEQGQGQDRAQESDTHDNYDQLPHRVDSLA